MGAEFSITVTEVEWFGGHHWEPMGGPCNHDCLHRSTAVIAWGPTLATYELEECTDCLCRAWRDGRWQKERQRTEGDSGFWNRQMVWRRTDEEDGQ